MVVRGASVYRASHCQAAPTEVPAQHPEILLLSQNCSLPPAPPSRYYFLMKSLILMIQFFTLCEKLIDLLCIAKSKSRKQSQGLRVHAFLHRSCSKRPQALLRLLDNCNICESSKKTPSPLSSAY